MTNDKITPEPVPNAVFLREGSVAEVGNRVQELGTYGVYLETEQTSLVECAGYLVRTKPENEGHCSALERALQWKGIAVLDSVVLVN